MDLNPNTNTKNHILRVGNPNSFKYVYESENNKQNKQNNKITDEHVLDRIKSLHIPPAYTGVVIYPPQNKIQAFGYDTKGRKQTIYAKWFVEQQSAIKFDRVLRLKRIVPKIQADVNRVLNAAITNNQFVITNDVQVCMIVRLMMLCNFRIGNSANVTKYKSYGLTTLQWRHINMSTCRHRHNHEHDSSCKIAFSFVGKKGVVNEGICGDRKVNKLLQHMYAVERDEQAPVFTVTASHVNDYLKRFSDEDISSKDLRTWQANALFMKYFNKSQKISNVSLKKRQAYALQRVAEALHNTPAVCRRSYIYPEFLMKTS